MPSGADVMLVSEGNASPNDDHFVPESMDSLAQGLVKHLHLTLALA